MIVAPRVIGVAVERIRVVDGRNREQSVRLTVNWEGGGELNSDCFCGLLDTHAHAACVYPKGKCTMQSSGSWASRTKYHI